MSGQLDFLRYWNKAGCLELYLFAGDRQAAGGGRGGLSKMLERLY